MNKLTMIGCISSVIFFGWLAWAFWFIEANNYSDKNVPGTYVIYRLGESSTLTLRPDHSYQQELVNLGKTSHASGTWDLFPSESQNHIEFSSGFLVLPGQELSPDGIAYGQLENQFGFLSIIMGPRQDGPKFHKHLF